MSKPKINLEETPLEVIQFRKSAEKRIAAAEEGLPRMKVFSECWHEEQEIWLRLHPERQQGLF